MTWARRPAAAVAACALVAAVLGATAAAASGPTPPAPSYANTVHVFIYDAPIRTDGDFETSRKRVTDRIVPGPFAKVGFSDYFPLQLPWNTDLGSPVLTTPTAESLIPVLERLESAGLVYHMSAMFGMSRNIAMYQAAKREDRRNAQWFADNLIAKPEVKVADATGVAWVTPSRYARKMRRHFEAKARAFARLFEDLRADFPQTLVSASGDAEAELSEDRGDPAKKPDDQMIADYSPFAILEFRDWLLHAGLYAPGGPYAGQGYKKKRTESFVQGTGALTPENLAALNATFKTSFTSWNLEYFNWSLSDPVDGDPKAIPFKKYKKNSWKHLPTSGVPYVAGGFDAPRSKKDPHAKWWKVWLKFREQMVASFARDVAGWITSAERAPGAAIPTDRWYTHQIPGDYLFGRFPGGPNPFHRLRTSASKLGSSMIPAASGSPGLTILDRFDQGSVYSRTSQHLFDAVEAKRLPNWGIVEYGPSWHTEGGPDTDRDRIKAQWHRAYAAGAHVMSFTPWSHFWQTLNGNALGHFIEDVKNAPRVPFHRHTRELFVAQCHRDLLGREPTANELAVGVAGIADGSRPRQKLVMEMIEYGRLRPAGDTGGASGLQTGLALLTRFTLALFDRRPTTAEVNSWRSTILGLGCTGGPCASSVYTGAIQSLVLSSEFKSRYGQSVTGGTLATLLFQKLLGRSPSTGELNTYGPLSPGDMARAVASHPTAVAGFKTRTTIVLAFAGLLRQVPTQTEFNTWRSLLDGGARDVALGQTLIVSDQYLARFPS